MSTPITLYDIPSKLPINAWSPNTWKARYALNFKGIPYCTEWVEYPDIEGLYKKLNVPASATKQDGVTPYYTLPLLHDSSTGVTISDSAAIVEYLEATYPDTPCLIPPGTRTLHAAFTTAFESQMKAIAPFSIPAVNTILNPRSEAFYRKTREESSGVTIEEMNPLGERREKQWTMFKHDLGKADKWMKEGNRFVMGETATFADVTMCAWILFLRISLGEDSPEFQDLSTWHGGRWSRLLKSFKKYGVVV
ncbi:hypothetical protein DFS33DRAFT_1346383 [Desarmillaria ectypa]|nr:hypothetical protein DFS33DRAFT_1346383 [Desarmillaria ectypa]